MPLWPRPADSGRRRNKFQKLAGQTEVGRKVPACRSNRDFKFLGGVGVIAKPSLEFSVLDIEGVNEFGVELDMHITIEKRPDPEK